MSEIVRGCHQGVMGHKLAEDRLRGSNKDFSYLTRESDIKKGKFILSTLTAGSVKHTVAPNPSARKNFQSLEEASEVLEKMISSNKDCLNAIPPPDIDTDANNNSMDDWDRPAADLACYACDFVGEHRRELNDHHRSHTVKECPHCEKFIHHNSVKNHMIKCQKTDPEVFSCDQCDYETKWISALRSHKQKIHNREYKCDLCTKSFICQETLTRHKQTHTVTGDGFRCEECNKTFKTLATRDRHRKSQHLVLQSEVGFMMLDMEQMANTAPAHKKGERHKCPMEGCPHVAQSKAKLNRHILHRHKTVSSPRKVYKCDGCQYSTSKTSNFRVHLLRCKKHKELHPRVVPILTRDQLIKIIKQSSISDRKFLKLLQAIEKEAGTILFEGNLEREIRESMQSWEKFYEVKEVEITDKHGNTMKSSMAWVNNLNGLISAIIEEEDIQEARVVVGGDSGQGKFIFTLTVLDLANLGRDSAGYSRAGKRRTLVISAVDDCDENHENLQQIVEALKFDELEVIDIILAGDLKFANLCFGEFMISFFQNCQAQTEP